MAENAPVIKEIFNPLQSVAASRCVGMGIETWFHIFQKPKINNV